MNLEFDQKLEAAIDRELKTLSPMRAPQTLLPRVMATIAQRTALPWYRRAWQTWPMPLQTVSMLVLLTGFTGVSFAAWQLMHTPAFAAAASEVGGWFAWLSVVWETLGVLSNAVALAFKSLGSVVIIGGVVVLLLGYAMCVGLGTIYVRLAFARR